MIFLRRPTIRSLLEKGESVIVDRYAFSGVAFTAAKVIYNSIVVISLKLNYVLT